MNTNQKLKIAAIQPHVKSSDLKHNLEHYEWLLDHYSNNIQSCDVLCFPEYWNGIKKSDLSESKHDRSLNFLEELAKSYSIWIVGGSQIVNLSNDFFNRSHIFNPSGKMIGTYEKKKLFGFERINDIIPGSHDFIWKIKDWKVSIRICSDLWSTSDYAKIVNEELDLIFCPIMTTLPKSEFTNYGRFLWHNLAVIRAKEAASSVIVSDTAMQPIREPFWCAGASCIVDPSYRFTNQDHLGYKILSSLPEGQEGVIVAQIDLIQIKKQKNYRKEVGLLEI